MLEAARARNQHGGRLGLLGSVIRWLMFLRALHVFPSSRHITSATASANRFQIHLTKLHERSILGTTAALSSRMMQSCHALPNRQPKKAWLSPLTRETPAIHESKIPEERRNYQSSCVGLSPSMLYRTHDCVLPDDLRIARSHLLGPLDSSVDIDSQHSVDPVQQLSQELKNNVDEVAEADEDEEVYGLLAHLAQPTPPSLETVADLDGDFTRQDEAEPADSMASHTDPQRPTKKRRLPAFLLKEAPKVPHARPFTSTSRAARALSPAKASASPLPSMPTYQYSGAMLYMNSFQQAERTAAKLLTRALDGSVGDVLSLGFDIEWAVTFRGGEAQRPAALLQLCVRQEVSHDEEAQECEPKLMCYLFHLHFCGFTPTLRKLLCSDQVRLLGVNIGPDLTKLERDFGETLNRSNVVELREFALTRELPVSMSVSSLTCRSLKALSAQILRVDMDKRSDARLSNWESPSLSASQRLYAASDAAIGLLLFEKLMEFPELDLTPQQQRAPPPMRVKSVSNVVSSDEVVPREVPCLPKVRSLSHSKLTVYQLFHLSNKTIHEIAVERNIQESTVCSYLCDALDGGYEYRWDHRMGVTDATFEAVVAKYNALSQRPADENSVANSKTLSVRFGSLKKALDADGVDLSFSQMMLAVAHMQRTRVA